MVIEGGASQREPDPSQNRFVQLAVVGAAIAALLAAAYLLKSYLHTALEWVEGLGPWGVVAFVVLYVLATVSMVPASLLTLGAGAIWGVLWGLPIVSLSSVLGASAAFLVGRYIARGWVRRMLEGRPRFQAVDEAVGEEGWKVVALTRLSPVFPFNLQNYAYGLTGISFWPYFFASWIAMLPGTLMYVYIGAAAGSLATVGADNEAAGGWRLALFALGLVATIMVTVYITRTARRKLAEKVGAVVDNE